MAKYTDPNTGVKYSTHTGLKVFTVIVVILLVISIVLNVVLYTQNSDDSELDTGESGEFDDGYENGENGEDNVGNEDDGSDGGSSQNSGSSSNQGSSKSDDSEDDEPPAASQESEGGNSGLSSDEDEDGPDENGYYTSKNKNAERTSKYSPSGVADCLYFYDDCSICEDKCVGHKMYITENGGVYSTYIPLYITLEPVSPVAGEEEIRVSLMFEYNSGQKDDFVSRCPDYYEIVSLTSDTVNVESVKIDQDLTYTVSRNEAIGQEHVASYTLKETAESNESARVYKTEGDFDTFGHFTISIELDSGNEYVYEFKYIDDTTLWSELMTEEDREKERAEQEEMQSVTSEGDTFVEAYTYEDGVVRGTYFYDSCPKCPSDCIGHTMYRSASGGYYDFYPYTEALTLTDEDGDIISEMQVSLVFEEKPEYEDGCYLARPVQIEVASLTEKELGIDASTLRQLWEYRYDSNNESVTMVNDADNTQLRLTRSDTSTATIKAYKISSWALISPDGYFGFYLTMSDDSVYTCYFSMVGDSITWNTLKSGNYTIRE